MSFFGTPELPAPVWAVWIDMARDSVMFGEMLAPDEPRGGADQWWTLVDSSEERLDMIELCLSYTKDSTYCVGFDAETLANELARVK